MPSYCLRYRVETCLNRNEDLALEYGGYRMLFLFSQKKSEDRNAMVEIEVEAKDNREAQEKASGIVLPQVLDALSFTTCTPLLLGGCELVLKDESGSLARRAIYVAERKVPTPVRLTDESIEDAKAILGSPVGPGLPLCWHRYALVRRLALDRFVFQWLAFEGLAGERHVAVRCPNCGHERAYRGSNKDRAYEIFAEASPGTGRQEFNEEIWGKARNTAFHGTKYPNPSQLLELTQITENLWRACEIQFARLYRPLNENREPEHFERLYRVFYFVEWETAERTARYAPDPPAEKLGKMAQAAAPGISAANFPDMSGFALLNYNRDAPSW
jgi:hypothetical protein